MDNLAHVVMLVIIVGLVSLYLQLVTRYEDLSQTCAAIQRTTREAAQLEDFCTGSSQGDHSCILHEDSSVATSQLTLKSSQLSAQADRYSKTKIVTNDRPPSGFISESSFQSQHAPFETSEQLTVDEFGRTDREKSDIGKEYTESPTGVVSPPDISHVELTNAEEGKLSESQMQEVQLAHTVGFQFQPSSTVGQGLVKRSNAYSQYEDINGDEYHSEDDVTTESVFAINEDAGLASSATRFSDISLSILETSRDVRVPQKASSIDMQHFSQTSLSSASEASVLPVGSILSTDNKVAHNKHMCHSENCDSEGHSRLYIQPVPADTSAVHNAQEKAGVKDDHEEDLSHVIMQAGSDALQTLIHAGTSAWCDSSGGGYTCQFDNLCYKTAEEDFIFLKGQHSVLEQLPSHAKLAMDDLFSISLSPVPDHNAMKFSPVFLPASGLGKFSKVAIIQGTSFVVHRFKPDNVMHVLHDDVLPLHHSLHSLGLIPPGRGRANVTILFTDHFGAGEYVSLYRSLSLIPPISLRNFNDTADIVCFARAYLGLPNKTLWYQYGFFKMQGPLEVPAPDLLLNIRRAAAYLAAHLQQDCMFCTKGNYLILLSRKDNRRIINEGELMMSVARATKLKVLSISMETHSVEEIISSVTKSRGIIGMHGSLLSFLIFLPPGSIVVELFPYAVNPLNYTPFKTLCDMPGSEVTYKSWSNSDRVKSVPHPDWDPKLGGIHHLPIHEQKAIVEQTEVPGHLCCEDPSWLYHIYQDTIVDTEAVTSLVTTALTEASESQVSSKSEMRFLQDIPIMPGPVRDLNCKSVNLTIESNYVSTKYLLIWKLPWNLEFIEYGSLEFQLVISEYGHDNSIHVELPSDVMFYSLEPARQQLDVVYNVWVRATIDKHLSGPHVYVACKHSLSP